jgi:hypothetical protein
MTGNAFFTIPPCRGAFTLSFRASGVLHYAGVVICGKGNVGILTLIGTSSAAWNLGQRETLCFTGKKDLEPVYSGNKGYLRRGFFGRPKKQDSLRMTVLEKQSCGMPQYRGRSAASSPPCHSEQAVLNKNTNMKL